MSAVSPTLVITTRGGKSTEIQRSPKRTIKTRMKEPTTCRSESVCEAPESKETVVSGSQPPSKDPGSKKSDSKRKFKARKRKRPVDEKSARQIKHMKEASKHLSKCKTGCCCSQHVFSLVKENRARFCDQISELNTRLIRAESETFKPSRTFGALECL